MIKKKITAPIYHFLDEMRDCLSRIKLIDLAIGVILGASFGKIINALVFDIIAPPFGLLCKGIDVTDLFIALNGKHYATISDARQDDAPIIAYGHFLDTVLEFSVNILCVFLMLKAIKAITRISMTASGVTNKTDELLTEIRDALKK